MAWADRKVTAFTSCELGCGLPGQFVGAIVTAGLVFLSGQYALAAGQSAQTHWRSRNTKCVLPFVQAVVLGILCNGSSA